MDELIKHKLEALNEVKAKEKEEKDMVAQQVLLFWVLFKDKFKMLPYALYYFLLFYLKH